MLRKEQRIRRKEYTPLLNQGKRYNSPHLLLYVAENNSSKNSKFSFSASKKVYKFAVGRNLLRRRGYSVINKLIKETKPKYLCFFSFKKGSYDISYQVLEKEIKELLSLSGVIS